VINVQSFVDEGLGHSSYLIAFADGTGVLIDPPRFPTAHRSLADRLDVRIRWTFDTHSHADYITGSPNLTARDGITFVAPAASHLATPHHPIHDADRVDVADAITLTAIATPGHTPDHHAYLLTDHGRPVGLFTGGSLMVGTVGRTDLCGPDLAVPLAHDMFHSLRRFDDLPDDLVVYPTHGAGSFCSAPGTSQRTSTLGHERATNPLLTIRSEDEFVARLVAGFGTFPTYFFRLPELNRVGPTRYDTVPDLRSLTAVKIERHQAAGGVVVDARPVAAFAAGHLPGSISNTLRPVFASWLGWLTEADQPVAFVLDADQNRDDLVRQCLDIGHEQLVGELSGGIDAWSGDGLPLSTIPLIDAADVTRAVVDVRQANEYATGHLPDAVNIELGQIPTAELPAGPITVMCGHGERAMTAASVLAALGRNDLVVLDGGPDTWSRVTGTPLVTGR
jgi:hydroxyacylglutathione hydrolase